MSRQKAFLLALTMLLIPIALLMVFSLTRVIFQETGMSMRAQRKTRSFFVCQAALSSAFHVFSCNNHRGHTHESNGSTRTSSSDPDYLTAYTMPDLALDGDGWYAWSCAGDDRARSFTRSGIDERSHFQIFLPSPGRFTIRAEGNVGGFVSRQEQSGSLTPEYDYAIFDNGNTNDFSRAEQHQVEGKVHANGDIFLRPMNSKGFAFPPPPLPPLVTLVKFIEPAQLDLKVDRLTTAGKVIRATDHLGNPDPGGYVRISKGDKNGPMVPLEGSAEGGPYDSNHPNWRDSGPSGAIARYGGTVVDSELGAVKQNVPSRRTLTPGGYYDQKAGLKITAATSQPWCQDVTFYNQNECREVTAKEIDVAAMQAAGAFPDNGLIYADTPVRLVKAHALPGDMTLASCSSIYTKGDFNKDDPDGAGPNRRHSASLMTTDRVYNLTSKFDDEKSYEYPDPIMAVLRGGLEKAKDPPLYQGDPDKVLEINAAITDGAPTSDVRSWIDEPDNPYFIRNNFFYGGSDTGTKKVPDEHDPGHPGLKSSFANPDDFLENLQDIKVTYLGSNVHNRNAVMSKDYNNSDLASEPWRTAWLIKAGYVPPQYRVCKGDSQLVDRPPPGAPQAARKLLWREL